MSQGTNTPTTATPSMKSLVDERLVACYFVVAMVYMLVSLTGGLLMALQLVGANPFDSSFLGYGAGDEVSQQSFGVELLSPGRWRMIHTNAIAYGFLANAFFGALHWAIPRLTLKPVLSSALSWFLFVVYQVVVLATAGGILMGEAQGLEWGETPWWIDPLAQVGLILYSANFAWPIMQMKGSIYVSNWYFLAGLVWTPLVYAMGNFLCQYFLPGTGGGAIAGMFIHDLVGLFVTPLGWGLMYYFVPIILKKPMWSHALSLVGFWGLAFFYPLTGIHHFLYTPIPMFLQHGAIISTIAVEFVVATVIINFMGTIWGSGWAVLKNLPLRWFYTGMVFYFLTCLQCAFHTTLTFQKVIHFTDWVVGHAHMVMFGVFAFWLLGIMTYLFPRILRTEWYSMALAEWHYWLSTIGLTVMISALILVGVFQGFSWAALDDWNEYLKISTPFWWVRLGSGLMIIAGQLCFLYNLYMTWRNSAR